MNEKKSTRDESASDEKDEIAEIKETLRKIINFLTTGEQPDI